MRKLTSILTAQDLVAYFFVPVAIDINGIEWLMYDPWRWRPYTKVHTPIRDCRRERGNQAERLAKDPQADRYNHLDGYKSVTTKGRIACEKYMKPDELKTATRLDRMEYRVYKLDKSGISIVP